MVAGGAGLGAGSARLGAVSGGPGGRPAGGSGAFIVRVARLALDRRKVLTAFLGLILTALAFVLFASLGNVVGSAAWRTILAAVGAGAAYLVLAFTCFVLARMVQFEASSGGVRPGVVMTVRHCLGRLWALLVLPLGLVLAGLIAVALMVLVAWIGRIAPTVYTFLFLAEFALGAAAVAAAGVLTWGLFLYPAILAVEDTDELDTLRVYLGLYHRDGLALAGYEALVLALTWVAALVPGMVALAALALTLGVSAHAMGPALALCLRRMPQALRWIASAWAAAVGAGVGWLLPWFRDAAAGLRARLDPAFDADQARAAAGAMYGLSGTFLGVSLLVIVAATLAYALVFFVAAGTCVYLSRAEAHPRPADLQRAAA